MKRVISILGLLLAIGLFSASLVVAAPVQIRVAVTVGPNAEAAKALVPLFEAQNPDIRVDIVEIPWTDIYQMQLLDFMAKKGSYDLVMQSTSFFGEYVLGGHLEPLDPYFNDRSLVDKAAFNLNDFNQRVLAVVGSHGGKLYALPFMYFPQILVYRADLLEKVGATVPKTFDQYLEVVKKLDQLPGIHGTSVIGIRGGAGANVYAWAPYLYSFGGDFVDKNGKPTLNSPQAVKALEFYTRLYQYSPSEAVNMGTDQVTSAFGAGDLGMILMDADNAGALLDPNYTKFNGVTRYAVIPEGPAKVGVAGQGTPLLGAWSLGISKYSKHKKEAFKVLTFFLGNDPKTTETFVKFGIHPRASVLEKYSSTYPNYAIVAKELQDVKTIPVVPDWAQIEEALGNAISKAMLGQATPKQALDQAQKLAEVLVGN